MSNREPLPSPWQKSFQNECRAFITEAEALADYARQHPEDSEYEQADDMSKGLIGLWIQIAQVKDTGLDMVAETPRCSLVLKEHEYWFIRALADQTEFEDECDEMEARLDGLIMKVERHELENLWVAGVLESMALYIQDRFHV